VDRSLGGSALAGAGGAAIPNRSLRQRLARIPIGTGAAIAICGARRSGGVVVGVATTWPPLAPPRLGAR